MVGLDIVPGHTTNSVLALEDGEHFKGKRNLTNYLNSDYTNVTNGLLSQKAVLGEEQVLITNGP